MKRYLYLTPVLGGPGAPRYPVSGEIHVIGRSEQADISLLEPTVSRRHATVQGQGDTVQLKDLGSKHGTFVNSRRVTSSELHVGDIVVFGLSLVLRLEVSNEPVSPPDDIGMSMDTPTLIDPLDRLAVTALRESVAGHAMQPHTGSQPVDAVEACAALLPEVHVRLSELRENLRRMVNDGIDDIDPYPILASVESVLSTMNRVMQVVGAEEEIPSRVVELRGLVRRVVDRVAPSFTESRIKFMSDIGKAYRVRCDTTRLEGALALLLRNAGRASPEGNPVEIMATGGEGTVRLAISHLGREYPADVLEGSGDRSSSAPLVRDMAQIRDLIQMSGGSVTVESRTGIGSTVRLILPAPTPTR